MVSVTILMCTPGVWLQYSASTCGTQLSPTVWVMPTPMCDHADAAVLDGLAGVAVYSQRPAGVFYQNLAFRRQAQLFFILIKYMNAELLLQLAHMMADSGLCERKPLCRPCVTARTVDLQEGLYLRIKHFAPQFIKKIYTHMKSHNLILS